MSASRRDFLHSALFSGAFAPLLGTSQGNRLFQNLLAVAGQADGAKDASGAHDSEKFWSNFGAAANSQSSSNVSGVRGRGLFSKKPAVDTSAGAVDRQIDFFHWDAANKNLRFVTSVDDKELMDYKGDITANVNVNGFHMAGEDRAQFKSLQSAQLRIDVVQTKSLMQNLLDPMSWTSLAGLFPGNNSGELPPMQNLSFSPGSASNSMAAKQVVLPGGSGQWAVNLSMVHKESTFGSVLQMVCGAADRWAPIVGLPAISITALQGFSSLYGAFEQRTTFLLNSFPQLAFATRQARAAATSAQGFNLVAGDYILVPHAHTAELTANLDNLEVRQGYLVPKGAPTNTSIYDIALNVKPDITYLSTTIGFKPIDPASLT
jgi:hypothetical protein